MQLEISMLNESCITGALNETSKQINKIHLKLEPETVKSIKLFGET